MPIAALLLAAKLLATKSPKLITCDAACRQKVVEQSRKLEPIELNRYRFDNAFQVAESWKAPVRFNEAVFEDVATFDGFAREAAFSKVQFRDDTIFSGDALGIFSVGESEFQLPVQTSLGCGDECIFSKTEFRGRALFDGVHGETLELSDDHFYAETSFRNAFLQSATVSKSTFEEADFTDASFLQGLRVTDSSFAHPPRLARTNLFGEVHFDNCKFPEGLDLRFANLSAATVITFDGIKIEPRNFRFDWNQLRRTDQRRLDVQRRRLQNGRLEDDEESFPRLVATYELLAAALDDQGNDEDADRVRYELERRRQEVDGNLVHDLYGLFFGFGYAPWRVTLLAVPILLLFALLYRRHRHTVSSILDSDIRDKKVSQDEVRPLARAAHLLFFSTAVLLSIRFNSGWIRPKEPGFLGLVIVEWLLGIGLYVLFFACVKTSGFVYVKGLLGF